MYQADVPCRAVVFAKPWEGSRGCRRKRALGRNIEGTSRSSLTVYSKLPPLCTPTPMTANSRTLGDDGTGTGRILLEVLEPYVFWVRPGWPELGTDGESIGLIADMVSRFDGVGSSSTKSSVC